MRNLLRAVMILAALAISRADAQQPHNYCQSFPIRANALDFPSKHAWDLFLTLSHPALDRKIERGKPDCTKPIGTPGTTAVWESWRNAGGTNDDGKSFGEVFLSGGVEPPDWNDNKIHDEKPGQVPKTLVRNAAAMSIAAASDQPPTHFSFHDLALMDSLKPMFSPDDGMFTGGGAFGETRMNRATYEFIKRECLWSREGLERYAQAFLAGKKSRINFPPDAMEVKAAWISFTREGVPASEHHKYYTAEYKGEKYGLMTLHVLTKDIPNWFWASFHHVDQLKYQSPADKGRPLKPGVETEDKYGRPKILDGTVWENYKLGGTQTEFESDIGEPTMLSDAHVEKGFVRSSCITCHATAVISPDKSPPVPDQRKALCILSPGDTNFGGVNVANCKKWIGEKYFGQDDKLISERGAPLAEWYLKNGKLFYLPTDFLYSIPLRAQAETSPPPDRCKW